MKNTPAFNELKKRLGRSIALVLLEVVLNAVVLYSVYNILEKLGRLDILVTAVCVWFAMFVYTIQSAFQIVKNKKPDPASFSEKLKAARLTYSSDPVRLREEITLLTEEDKANQEKRIQSVVDKSDENRLKALANVTFKILNAGIWFAVYLNM